MKKFILGAFLLTGTTFTFANNVNTVKATESTVESQSTAKQYLITVVNPEVDSDQEELEVLYTFTVTASSIREAAIKAKAESGAFMFFVDEL